MHDSMHSCMEVLKSLLTTAVRPEENQFTSMLLDTSMP